jgi:hypothetical protein
VKRQDLHEVARRVCGGGRGHVDGCLADACHPCPVALLWPLFLQLSHSEHLRTRRNTFRLIEAGDLPGEEEGSETSDDDWNY